MGLGVILGASHGTRHASKGHDCKCPGCGKVRKDCAKACYNYKCPKCGRSMVPVKKSGGRR